MEFAIGDVDIKYPIVLAPMAGISTPAYLKIIEEMGVGYGITELISSEAVVRENKKTFDMLAGIEELKIPMAIQIFGSDPQTMARSAQILTEKFPVSFIDINMGCPVPKVAVRAKSGSALLKDPERVEKIVRAVVDAVLVPVTVKIRSGWDQQSINAVDIAKICEKAGASAIAVHARTRSQGYQGKADWNIIKKVKEAVHIPVIGNGDVKSVFDVERMLEETGCDAVMIGRGALGNPWLFQDTILYLREGKTPRQRSKKEKIDMCLHHLDYLVKQKGEMLAKLEIRNPISWYLKGLKNSSEIKNKIYQCENIHDIIILLENYKEDCYDESKI